jgi:hypothetical protein
MISGPQMFLYWQPKSLSAKPGVCLARAGRAFFFQLKRKMPGSRWKVAGPEPNCYLLAASYGLALCFEKGRVRAGKLG